MLLQICALAWAVRATHGLQLSLSRPLTSRAPPQRRHHRNDVVVFAARKDDEEDPDALRESAEILALTAEKLRLEARKEELELEREKKELGIEIVNYGKQPDEEKKKPPEAKPTGKMYPPAKQTVDVPVKKKVTLAMRRSELGGSRSSPMPMDEEAASLLASIFPEDLELPKCMDRKAVDDLLIKMPQKTFLCDSENWCDEGAVFRGKIRISDRSLCYDRIEKALNDESKYQVLLVNDPYSLTTLQDSLDETLGPPEDVWPWDDKSSLCGSVAVVVVDADVSYGSLKSRFSSLTPDRNPILTGLLVAVSIYTLLAFGSSCFPSRELETLIQRGQESVIFDAELPIALGVAAVNVIHEAAHFIAAKQRGIDWSLPGPTPSLNTGLLGSHNAIKSFPKTRSDVFDTALVGPLAGLVASLVFMLVGATLFPLDVVTPTAAAVASSSSSTVAAATTTTTAVGGAPITLIPRLPAAAVRSSFLASLVVAVSHPDVAQRTVLEAADVALQCHPLFVAGLVSATVAALQLLPLGQRTDGGRALWAIAGRNLTQFAKELLLVVFFANAIFSQNDLLMTQLLSVFLFAGANDPPCRDEATPVDERRRTLYMASLALSAAVLVPCPFTGLLAAFVANVPTGFPAL